MTVPRSDRDKLPAIFEHRAPERASMPRGLRTWSRYGFDASRLDCLRVPASYSGERRRSLQAHARSRVAFDRGELECVARSGRQEHPVRDEPLAEVARREIDDDDHPAADE